MTTLWWTMAALVALSLVFVCIPFFRRPAASVGVDQQQANIDLHREHLEELEGQFQRGEIDDEQLSRLRAEQERTLLQESQAGQEAAVARVRGNWLAWGLAVLIPLAAYGIYWQLGASQDLEIVELLEEATQLRQQGDPSRASMVRRELLARIGERLEQDSENFYYWVITARLRKDDGDLAGALQAYRRAEPISPNDTTLLEEYLQTAFLVAEGKPTTEMSNLVSRILALSPNNLPVLGLSGRLAMEGGDYQRAITDWKRVLDALPPEHVTARMLAAEVDKARQKLIESGGQEVAPALELNVRLSDKFVAQAGDVLFVIARKPGQPGPPLAVKRVLAAKLPLQVALDDSNLMLPGSSFGDVGEVEVIARLSATGTPQAQPGDRQGVLPSVAVGSGSVTEILIDQLLE